MRAYEDGDAFVAACCYAHVLAHSPPTRSPDDLPVVFAAAVLRTLAGLHDEALSSLTLLQSLFPTDPRVLFALAQMQIFYGDFQPAQEVCLCLPLCLVLLGVYSC
jgi:hypothetical protein